MIAYPEIGTYVKKVGIARIILNVVLVIALMILFTIFVTYIFGGVLVVSVLLLFLLLFIALLAFNIIISSKVMYSAALSFTVENNRVRVQTKKKTYSFDVLNCVKIQTYPNRFVVFFKDKGDLDSVTFYRHLPFSSYAKTYFSEEDMRQIDPVFKAESASDV